jgi:hypothetical protein
MGEVNSTVSPFVKERGCWHRRLAGGFGLGWRRTTRQRGAGATKANDCNTETIAVGSRPIRVRVQWWCSVFPEGA